VRLAEDELLRLAASAEHRSEHPLAQAVVRAAAERGIALAAAEEFTSVPGRGVTAQVDGRRVTWPSLKRWCWWRSSRSGGVPL
jgi:cation transport ATPase